MKRTFLVLSLALLSITSLQAQLLWKVSGNGLQAPSYVFGTHHLASLSIIDSIKGLRQAFINTKQVYGELKMSDSQRPDSMATMQGMMMIQNDTTLQKLYPIAADYDKINAFCKENLMFDISMTPKMKPSVINNNVMAITYMKRVGGFNPEEQLDSYFQKEGLKTGKKVCGLETMQFQFNLLFNGQSLKRQAENLLCTLNNLDEGINMLKKLTAAYMKQDLKAIEEVSNEEHNSKCNSTAAEDEAMVYQRTKKWSEKLPAIMKEAPTFVAVGAYHLIGDRGLLQLLRAKGYKVEPVK